MSAAENPGPYTLTWREGRIGMAEVFVCEVMAALEHEGDLVAAVGRKTVAIELFFNGVAVPIEVMLAQVDRLIEEQAARRTKEALATMVLRDGIEPIGKE